MATLSIVTICFNNLEELKTTMASVAAQTRLPQEYWIIDGSKNSEIRDYLSSTDLPPYVKWISEPDKGISDGFNKGVSRCTQDVVHILNSGDYYYNEEAVATVMAAFDQDPELMWTHAQFKQFLGGHWIISGTAFDPDKLYMGMRQVAHPTMFLRREVYDRIGLFPNDLRDAMDYDLLIRLRNEKFKYLQQPIAVFTPGGNSEINWKRCYREGMRAYQKHVGNDWRLQIGYVKQLLVHAMLNTPIGDALLKGRKG
ncbi:glycosyltransferase [bacterium]|nr:glycosyltransferase [bacterium]